MKKAFDMVNGLVATISELLAGLIVLGVMTGILFEDTFGVIDNIAVIMGDVGNSGLAGLVALILIVLWYKK